MVIRLIAGVFLFLSSIAPVFAGAGTDGMFDEHYFERIEQHLTEKLGNSDTVWHEIVSPDIHLDLLPFPPTTERPYWTVATVGMSYLPMTVPASIDGDWERAELMILLPADWAGDLGDQSSLQDDHNWAPFRLLKQLARYPHNHNTFLAAGHTVEFQEPISPDSKMTAAMVHWSVALSFDELKLSMPDGETVNFYAVYPIHSNERQIAIQQGSEVLFNAMLDADTGLIYDPLRASLADGN